MKTTVKKHIYLIVIALVFTVVTGCDFINPDETPPSYIEVESFTFDPTPTNVEMGPSASTNIKDVWVYVDDAFQGAYELPARFPVLKSGDHRIILSPGILLNGIAATRSPYPFYKSSINYVNLVENGTVTIDPTISYFDSVKCAFCEFFDGSGFSLTSSAISDTFMYQLPANDPNIFEGFSSGVVYLDDSNKIFEVTSTTSYDLPGSGAAVYLELDYKINNPMTAGIYIVTAGSQDQQIPLITLYPTDEWKKIYVQLGYTVSAYPNADGYKVFLFGEKQTDVDNPVFYVDNIKVVSF
jgi:hypothetical protein